MALKQLLRKLEKEKVEIEWQLKEMEWRLDQESSVRVLVVLCQPAQQSCKLLYNHTSHVLV